LYRSLSHCYLTITIPYEMACHWNWDTAVTGRRSIDWAMHGADQTQIFWDVTSSEHPRRPEYSSAPLLETETEYPRRPESSSAPLLETETSQIVCYFLSISDTSLTAVCLSLFCPLFSSFPSSQIPSPYKCHICA
jgi:hypothetical protein